MISAAEARANAATAAEENKIKFEQEADTLIVEKTAPVGDETVGEGGMSVGITLTSCDGRVADVVIDKLSQAGFDVAVAADTAVGSKAGQLVFTLYWSKDRGGNPGTVTRPKTAVID